MENRDGLIWMDGKLVPWRDAKVHVLTHSLHYGSGVFEGIRSYETADGAAIFRLKEHIKRFFNSAAILSMPIAMSQQEMLDAHKEVLRANKLKTAYLRPLLFYGTEKMGLSNAGLSTHVMIATWEWGAYLGAGALEKGISVKVSSFSRHHVNVSMCKAKAVGNYVNSTLAVEEARRCGYEEAILLDTQGFVAEGSGENIFIVRDGQLYTPPLESCLEGITRDSIIKLAADHGLHVIEKRITRDELYICDEIFFTGTAAEVTPICQVDGRKIGNGVPGEITKKLQTAYLDVVKGKNPKYIEWLDIV
jgi:branched-chain amino acid aminotransferase